MVNHLHLLLGISILPWEKQSFDISKDRFLDHEDRDRSARLAFTRSLRWSQNDLNSWQYSDYRTHFMQDERSELAPEAFDKRTTPTAALVTFSSSEESWNGTDFIVAAAKATEDRHVVVQITFRSDTTINPAATPCMLTVTVQKDQIEDQPFSSSPRIKWSCDLIPNQLHQTPPGWQFVDSSKRDMAPLEDTSSDLVNRWLFGDDVSAYDMLLWDVSKGDKKHFAHIDELLAAWQIWTPIVEAAEATDAIIYETGTIPWSPRGHGNHKAGSENSRASRRSEL